MPFVPVASPVVLDVTPRGDVPVAAHTLRIVLASDLDLSGVFLVLPESARPPGPALTWFTEAAFDYLGWREAGAYLVPVATVSPEPDGRVRLRIDCFVTEEGDVLRIGGAEAVVDAARIATFAHRWVNALLQCVTGLPGVLGTRIAYSRREAAGQAKEVWLAELGSPDQVRVSRDGVIAMLPAWTPGGGVAWTGYRSGNPDVWVEACPGCPEGRGPGPRVLSARQGLNSGPAWSPDGRLVALTLEDDGNPDIFLIDPATGAEIARLTVNGGIDTSPTWSPDGRTIAFVSDRGGSPQVWLMDSDGQNPRPLPLPGSYNSSPDWSPDGAEIAYQAREEGSHFAIRAYDLRTGSSRRIAGGGWDDEEPSWSPDGRMIAFTSTRRGRKLLFLVGADGAGARPLFPNGGDYFTPAWERPFATNGNNGSRR
jgi:TolB protein